MLFLLFFISFCFLIHDFLSAFMESSLTPEISTIYITNICTRSPHEDIKKNLYALCAAYGPVLEIVHTKAGASGSRAFVVFKEREVALAAMQELNSSIFLGRPLRAEMSHAVSDRVLQSQGINLKSKFTIAVAPPTK